MIAQRRLLLPIFALIACAVVACGGGGGGSSPNGTIPSRQSMQQVAIKIVVPAANRTTSAKLRRHFALSQSTAGAVVNVYLSPKASHPTALSTQAFDLSGSSPSCTVASNGGRTCTLTLAAPAGSMDVEMLTYDAAPVSGAIPNTAQQLGYGISPAQTITAGATNSVPFSIGGVTAGVTVTLPITTLHVLDPLTFDAVVSVMDSDGNVIVGANYVDANGNPVTITMSDGANSGLLAFSPTTFSSPLPSGVAVTYSPANLTQTQMQSGINLQMTATTSLGGGNFADLTIGSPITTVQPAALSTGAPTDMVLGSDGQMWSADGTGQDIAAINLSTLSAATVSLSSTAVAPTPNPYRITSGPDGRLWSTAYNGSGIIAVMTTGIPSSYFVTFGSGPWGIASDGTNLWFTEYNNNAVGEMTTSGTVLGEFATSAGALPTDIAAGTGGNMWFSETGLDQVAKVTPSGTVIQYPASPVSAIYSICAGPGGSQMWITDGNTATIASVSSTGTVTSHALPSAVKDSIYCTLGADGNIWFVSDGASSGFYIGRVTLPAATNIQVFPLPGAVIPKGMTVGPSGDIWVVDPALKGALRVQI